MVEREEKFKVFGKQRATTLIKTRLLKRLIRDERFGEIRLLDSNAFPLN